MPITGHIVTYDNMGISALIHPMACQAATSVAECEVGHHLIHGTVEGRKGHGTYVACMREDEAGPWIKLVARGVEADTAHEIKDLLGAFFDEVGADAGRKALVEFIVEDERSTVAAETARDS